LEQPQSPICWHLKLIDAEIATAKELLNHDFFENPPKDMLPKWQRLVQHCHSNSEDKVQELQEQVDTLTEELEIFDLLDGADETDNVTTARQAVANDEALLAPPPFSSLADPSRHNARCVSKATIDRIVTTDSQNRRKTQDNKMRNMPAKVWRNGWRCKLPSKIKVCLGAGNVQLHSEALMRFKMKTALHHFGNASCAASQLKC